MSVRCMRTVRLMRDRSDPSDRDHGGIEWYVCHTGSDYGTVYLNHGKLITNVEGWKNRGSRRCLVSSRQTVLPFKESNSGFYVVICCLGLQGFCKKGLPQVLSKIDSNKKLL
ncbi:hypothetical protein NE237_024409 [Protea cynaroides]|uniref:Uncharacterized protein n=1 Tax=Protea cynaroides TaxID=273540 RepID=A0A9Q0HEU2_9MAGN|nr:hypothetical protein NE237_024409 [Protea cynaroides]